jgi:large subunit ribosomal protein L22
MAETQTQTHSEVRAQAKWVHCSARKARLVLDMVRGRSVPEARTILAFSTRDVARDIDKVLRSAVANAEANHGFFGDDMTISACYADEGPRLKRWKPRARGRADRFIKGTCHITIRLTSLKPPRVVARPAKSAAPSADEASTSGSEKSEKSEAAAVEATPKAPKKAAAKPRAKRSDKGEDASSDAPKVARKRKPASKKAEE